MPATAPGFWLGANCELVEEYVLANGQQGIRARADIPAGTVIGVFDGEVRQFALDQGRLADADAHKEIAQVAVVGDVLLGLVTRQARFSPPTTGSGT